MIGAWCIAWSAVALSAAAPDLTLGVLPGQNAEAVDRVARAGLEGRAETRIRDRQALSENLVRTHFLETLNRFRLAPVDKQGELDARKFQKLVHGKREGREYVLAFSERELSFLFVRVPVPVDSANEKSDRMRGLREILRAIAGEGWTIAPKEKDRWGNVFFWTGRGREGAKLALWYVPEQDELRILLHDATR